MYEPFPNRPHPDSIKVGLSDELPLQLRPRDASLVSEMYQAHVNAMPNAARLLAGALTGTTVAADDVDDLDVIRRNTLAILRSAEQ